MTQISDRNAITFRGRGLLDLTPLTLRAMRLALLASCSLSPWLCAQVRRQPPCSVPPRHSDWLIFDNRELHFCLAYPPVFREYPAPPPDQFVSTRRFLQSLRHMEPGSPVTSASEASAQISFVLIPKPFSIRALERYTAPTGLDDTEPKRIDIGPNTFFFYGPGGGGVDYPDEYSINLQGLILNIQFDGPYDLGSKTPSNEMKQLEPEVLATFRLY